MKITYFVKIVKPIDCQSESCVYGGSCAHPANTFDNLCQDCFEEINVGLELTDSEERLVAVNNNL